jgi:hypothetical protein
MDQLFLVPPLPSPPYHYPTLKRRWSNTSQGCIALHQSGGGWTTKKRQDAKKGKRDRDTFTRLSPGLVHFLGLLWGFTRWF